EALPKGQCGACGYAGCLQYAEAVVTNPDVPPNLCIPGGKAVAGEVARLTGKQAGQVEARVACVHCAGSPSVAKTAFEYSGVSDCVAASLLHGGFKVCKFGCLGLGNCVAACPFDAIYMGEDGLPIVTEKCVGCGKCESACPKKVISMIPADAHVRVNCNSRDRGPIARRACDKACIGCGICVKECIFRAITLEKNLAVVSSVVCVEEECKFAACLLKCPTKAIRPAVPGVSPGLEPAGEVERLCPQSGDKPGLPRATE
ncbi:MAG: 4Fe-4S binding protein, partial [Negativicutes bacterium]|nr:4Fe-4S binding protein [Negativicutes bacterium]